MRQIFIEAEVNGIQITFLIGSGASLALVSKKLNDMIAQENRPELSDSVQKVFNASGNALTHYGDPNRKV
jgi:erythromycin esterase-like protein